MFFSLQDAFLKAGWSLTEPPRTSFTQRFHHCSFYSFFCEALSGEKNKKKLTPDQPLTLKMSNQHVSAMMVSTNEMWYPSDWLQSHYGGFTVHNSHTIIAFCRGALLSLLLLKPHSTCLWNRKGFVQLHNEKDINYSVDLMAVTL